MESIKVMSIESEAARVAFREQLKKSLQKKNQLERDADEADLIKEEAELLADVETITEDDDTPDAAVKAYSISGDKVVSKDEAGKDLSYFGDPSWVLIDRKTRERFSVNFGSNHESRKILDYTDVSSEAYRVFERLLIYSVFPGVDLSKKPLAAQTIKVLHTRFNIFMDWLSQKNYLRSDNVVTCPPDTALITADAIKDELKRLLEKDGNNTRIVAFTTTIIRWFQLARNPYCPEWLKPAFEFSDVLDYRFVQKIAKYSAQNRARWGAVEYDDLQPMLMTAKHYIETYSKDLFWLEAKYAEAVNLQDGAGRKKTVIAIVNRMPTQDLYKEVLEYPFATNQTPNVDGPWFEVDELIYYRKNTDYEANRYIARKPILDEISCLIGASTFTLFTFTGSRHTEMRFLKTDALNINGKPLDYKKDAIAQVEAAGENAFTLTRPLFKTDHYGRALTTPLPKIAAKAFAILIEIFRHSRDKVAKTDFVFPAGGYVAKGSSHTIETQNITKTKSKLSGYLRDFCDAAGVEYQHSHKCRKTLATLLINHDANSLEVIRYLLGHNSITMTMEYVMSLPGINEEILNHMLEDQLDKMTEWVTDLVTGHAAGGAGEHGKRVVDKNTKQFSGDRIPITLEAMVQSMKEANYFIHRTPAAWCFRLPSRVPHTAPCLPQAMQDAIESGEILVGTDIHVNPEHCQPHLCGDAGHSRSDLSTARGARKFAEKKVANATKAEAKKAAQFELDYWTDVERKLEFGNGRRLPRLQVFDGGK
jgi:hypothetical protein